MKRKYLLNDWQPNLILGIEKAPSEPIGFSSSHSISSIRPSGSPILYEDDAPLCTIAPTRSGKGRGVVVPNLLRYSGPAIVADIKGELTKITARRRKEMGQDIYVIDPTNYLDLSALGLERAQLNPLDSLFLPDADLETDASGMAEMLSRGNRGTKEPFWDGHGTGLNQGLMLIAAGDPEPANRNLGKVVEMLSSDDVTYNLAVILDTRGKTLNPTAYQQVSQVLQMPEVTRGGVIATAQSYIKPLMSPSVLKSISSSSFPLQRIIDGDPITVYLVIPPTRLHALRGLVKILIGTMLSAILSRRHRPDVSTYVVLDEVGQLESFPLLETLVTLCAGYGVKTHMIWQDMAQLKTYYPESWKTILNNCGVLQTFGINNGDLAAEFGRYLDISPSELQGMGREEQVLAVHGRGTLRCERLDYLRDAPLEMFDANPLFARLRDKRGDRQEDFETGR